MRGELKTKCRPLVDAFFGFDSGQHSKIQKLNRKKAKALKENYNFAYMVRLRVSLAVFFTDLSIFT